MYPTPPNLAIYHIYFFVSCRLISTHSMTTLWNRACIASYKYYGVLTSLFVFNFMEGHCLPTYFACRLQLISKLCSPRTVTVNRQCIFIIGKMHGINNFPFYCLVCDLYVFLLVIDHTRHTDSLWFVLQMRKIKEITYLISFNKKKENYM